jgi:hypothetical protein
VASLKATHYLSTTIMIKKIVALFDSVKHHIHLHKLEVKARKCVSRIGDFADHQLCGEQLHEWLAVYKKKSIELREIMNNATSDRREKLEAFIDKVHSKYKF